MNYRPRQITGAAVERFATPGYEADIAGVLRRAWPARPRRFMIPGPKACTFTGALRQTDSRPRIAVLQSLVSVN